MRRYGLPPATPLFPSMIANTFLPSTMTHNAELRKGLEQWVRWRRTKKLTDWRKKAEKACAIRKMNEKRKMDEEDYEMRAAWDEVVKLCYGSTPGRDSNVA